MKEMINNRDNATGKNTLMVTFCCCQAAAAYTLCPVFSLPRSYQESGPHAFQVSTNVFDVATSSAHTAMTILLWYRVITTYMR